MWRKRQQHEGLTFGDRSPSLAVIRRAPAANRSASPDGEPHADPEDRPSPRRAGVSCEGSIPTATMKPLRMSEADHPACHPPGTGTVDRDLGAEALHPASVRRTRGQRLVRESGQNTGSQRRGVRVGLRSATGNRVPAET